MTDVEIDSGYWEWHFLWVLYWPYLLFYFLFLILVGSDAVTSLVVYVAGAGILILAAAALGGLIGYFVEARQLRETDSEWVPNPWLYSLGHILLFPGIVAPIYLYQRHKHIGIPWAEARTVRVIRTLANLSRRVARQVRSPR